MPSAATIKPTHKAIQAYYATLEGYSGQRVDHELALRSAFQNLLAETAKSRNWMLIPEQSASSATVAGRTVRPDGTLRDQNSLPRGYWEAKDSADVLDAEIKKKTDRGYPLTNTIFEDTQTAVLFQNRHEVVRVPLVDRQRLCDLLNTFYSYTEPDIESFEHAVDEFKERVPKLGEGLADKIREAHADNRRFQQAFDAFFKLCQTALNPNIRQEAVDEMLVQHLLTERLIRTIFDKEEFTRQNVIAAEVEKVIDALVGKSFSRKEYLKTLDRFYVAIENAARGLSDFSDKQHLLNTVYERFFQGYSVDIADTHGIIYTPQPIVDFMCASVAEVLDTEFGLSLGSPEVQILDPCTGTANFIVNLLRRIPKKDLPRMYREQLFANEVMLMPYYIAALNIEHAYYELTGQYEPFDGLCFVDTLDMAEGSQRLLSYMTEANTVRVERQKKAPITVIIGNPPYNVGQLNENDNNKNRRYEIVDHRIKETFAKDSRATSVSKLNDPYVKFFRWAIDRLQGRDGVVCFVSNNSFVDQVAFDGMRKHLSQDFTTLYHADLHGNVRKNPKLSGTTHNVFGIQVGVGITVAVRKTNSKKHRLFYHRVPEVWRKEQKLGWLSEKGSVTGVDWVTPQPDERNTWLSPENADEFAAFLPLGSKEAKCASESEAQTIFCFYTLGVATHRDRVVYDFDREDLAKRVREFAEEYNCEVDRYKRSGGKANPDDFVRYDKIIWDRDLKKDLRRGKYAEFNERKIRVAMYRPFNKRYLFFDRLLNAEVYSVEKVFPIAETETENRAIWLKVGSEWPMFALVTANIPDLLPQGGSQCFPFYVYVSDGSERRENITDWVLGRFREHYGDGSITKWDIFYYVYGLLHHPGYRARFADNLKRELPRIPFAPSLADATGSAGESARSLADASGSAGESQHAASASGRVARPESAKGVVKRRARRDSAATPIEDSGRATQVSGFWAFANAGKQLAELHLNYEQLEPFPLQFIETPEFPLSYRVASKMRLSRDKSGLAVNESLALAGIPPETFDYRLGNRSALEWVIDQYQVSTDKRSGIKSDPNRPDDEHYIVRLIGQVVRVSVETVRIVAGLPENYQ